VTIRDAIRDGAALLAGRGRDAPWLDASLLLGAALGMDRSRLLAAYPEEAEPSALPVYRRALERRASGEPCAYILGRKEFRGLEFEVAPGVLVPRPETEVLVELVLEAAAAEPWTDRPFRLHDACTGSGCVGISLARELPAALGGRPCKVELSDISPEALASASRNAIRLLGRDLPALRSDFLEGLPEGAYDCICANPPYLSEADFLAAPVELSFEPRLALAGGVDGLDPLRAISARAARALRPGGLLACEIGSSQASVALEILERAGYGGLRVACDLAGLDRVVSGRTHG
jgi:release factor glutamine methyltransferase